MTILTTQLAYSTAKNFITPTLRRGSGNLVSEQRSIKSYNKVIANLAGDGTLMQGSRETLIIETEDHILTNAIQAYLLEIL